MQFHIARFSVQGVPLGLHVAMYTQVAPYLLGEPGVGQMQARDKGDQGHMHKEQIVPLITLT